MTFATICGFAGFAGTTGASLPGTCSLPGDGAAAAGAAGAAAGTPVSPALATAFAPALACAFVGGVAFAWPSDGPPGAAAGPDSGVLPPLSDSGRAASSFPGDGFAFSSNGFWAGACGAASPILGSFPGFLGAAAATSGAPGPLLPDGPALASSPGFASTLACDGPLGFSTGSGFATPLGFALGISRMRLAASGVLRTTN